MILLYIYVINPYEFSRKRKIFPYQFLYNLLFSGYKLKVKGLPGLLIRPLSLSIDEKDFT